VKTIEDTFGMPVKGPDKLDVPAAVAAIAAISAVGVAIGLTYPLLSILMEQRGYSSTLIGANTAMAGIASIMTVPFVNAIARRFGMVNTMVLAAVIATISLMGFHFFPDIRAWFALRITFHGAIAASFVLSEYWINSSAPNSRRGFILGIYATVLSLGFAAGPSLLAVLGSQGATPFLVGGAIILASTIPALVARKHQPRQELGGHSRSVLRYLWLVPFATGAAFVFGAAEQAGLALFPVYGARHGFDEQAVSLLLVTLAIGNVVFQIPLGALSDRMKDRRYLLLGCAAVGAVGSAILPYAVDHVPLLVAGIFVWGGVTAGMYTIGLAHLGARLTGAALAQANAAFILSYSVGMVIGPQYAGVLMDHNDPEGFAYALATIFGLFLVVGGLRIATGGGKASAGS
jgi:MFS family permease